MDKMDLILKEQEEFLFRCGYCHLGKHIMSEKAEEILLDKFKKDGVPFVIKVNSYGIRYIKLIK